MGGEHVGGGNMAAGVALAAPAQRLGLGRCVGSELHTPPKRGKAGPGSRMTAKWPGAFETRTLGCEPTWLLVSRRQK